jgi:hypothetical protein
MADPVTINVEKEVLDDLLIRARRVENPEVQYKPNTEEFLKNVIAFQQYEAGAINTILTNLLYPG